MTGAAGTRVAGSGVAGTDAAGLTAAQAAQVRDRFGTPCYVYVRAALEAAARRALALPAPYGLTVRYAMKANPSGGILALFRDLGLHIDASSDHEVERALRAGFPAGRDPAHVADALPPARRAPRPRRAVQRVLAPSARGLRPRRPRAIGLRPDEPGARERIDQSHQHGRSRVELRDLARASGRREGPRRALRRQDHAAAQPHRLRHGPGGLQARDAHDARPRRQAPRRERGEPGRGLQGRPHAGRAVGGPRRRGRARAPQELRAFRDRDGRVPSASRSSRGRISSPTPGTWWRHASTSSTPGATATCSPSSTRGCPR